MVEPHGLAEGESIAEGRRGEADIRVHEEEKLALRPLGSLKERVRLAEPALGEGNAREGEEPRVSHPPRDLRRRAVGRGVIHHDHLEERIVLAQGRVEGRPDRPLFVPRRNDDRDRGERSGGNAAGGQPAESGEVRRREEGENGAVEGAGKSPEEHRLPAYQLPYRASWSFQFSESISL